MGRGGRAEDDAARRETAFGRAAALLQENSGHLPSLVVLDLDYTIWPYYCEYYGPKDPATLYPDVLGIIHAVHAAGIPMAIASKSPATPTALGMLRSLKLLDLFAHVEVFHKPSKHEHFRRIREATGVSYEGMLFFDDEGYNIRTMSKLGVSCVDVSRGGLSVEHLAAGLQGFQQAQADSRGF